MKLNEIKEPDKKDFLIEADGELKASKEVFAVKHFLNGYL
jgi:hypothetical protein